MARPPSVDYIIQSVPSRRDLRQRLLDQLPPAGVVEDDGPPPGNPWRGYQLCLQRGLDDPTKPAHLLILQDDTLVCRNFVPALERLIAAVPENPVCLFYPGLAMKSDRNKRRAVQSERTLFILNRLDFVPIVAVLWPRAKAEHFYEWSRDVVIPGLKPPYRSDDAVAGYWMRKTRQDVYVALPSIVQHPDDADPVKDGPHVARNGTDRGRVAFSYCEDAGALEWQL